MKKESFNLGQGNTPYYSGGGSHYLGGNTGLNMPGDSLEGSTFDSVSSGAQRASQDNDAFRGWKRQLHTAIRRIDKLIRTDKHIDATMYKVLAEQLMNLSAQVQTLKMANTISDVTYRTANTFTKLGYSAGAEVLKKLAQEAPKQLRPDVVPEAPAEEPAAAAPPLPGAEEPAAAAPPLPGEEVPAAEEPSGPMSGIPKNDEVEPVRLEDITPIPGAREGEYAELAGDINLEDAARKLDEVAGMLADRRIIRQLAEFDIMLDKIGIASMFPELAESQSKLIDSYSYALTRVTKMMGQLANAKALVEAQTSIPGIKEPAEEPEQAPAPEELGPPE